MTLFLVVVALLAVAGLSIVGYKYFTRTSAQVVSGGKGVSAFAKLAEADGKIIALKTATEAKKLEADAAHSALDEVHKILG